jgi:hypothetical protein
MSTILGVTCLCTRVDLKLDHLHGKQVSYLSEKEGVTHVPWPLHTSDALDWLQDGIAPDALLQGAAGVTVDETGQVFFTDAGNNRIRMFRDAAAPPPVPGKYSCVVLPLLL